MNIKGKQKKLWSKKKDLKKKQIIEQMKVNNYKKKHLLQDIFQNISHC